MLRHDCVSCFANNMWRLKAIEREGISFSAAGNSIQDQNWTMAIIHEGLLQSMASLVLLGGLWERQRDCGAPA